jgi:hypothetical protein
MLIVTVFVQSTFSQTFSIQGVLRDPNGKSVADGTYPVTFNLYTVATGGSSIWTETINNVTVSYGVFSLELGTVTSMASLGFDATYYLGITVASGTELSPRMKIASSPTSLSVKGTSNVVPSNGNVGIGTLTPGYKLEVNNGDIKITGAGNGLRFHDGSILTSATSGSTGNVSNNASVNITYNADNSGGDDLMINHGATEVMRANSVGNVGIGTNSPTNKLSVSGNFDVSGNVGIGTTTPFYQLDILSESWANMRVKAKANNPHPAEIFFDKSADGAQHTASTGYSTDRGYFIRVNGFDNINVNQFGNVGIGTTAPAHKLHIVDDNNASIVVKGTGNNTNPAEISFDKSVVGAQHTSATGYASNRGHFIAVDGIDRFNVFPNGRFGFGTTAPAHKIDIFDDNNSTIRVKGTGNNTNPAEIVFDKTVSGNQHFSATGYATSRGHFIWVNGFDRLNVLPNGKVGIGTTTPGYPLEVNGGVGPAQNQQGSFFNMDFNKTSEPWATWWADISIKASHAVWATGFFTSSDTRVKNIIDISSPEKDLSLLNDLQVTDFTYVDNVGNGKAAKKGFIAQQVEKVFPEAVSRSTGFIPNIYKKTENTRFNATTKTLAITMTTNPELVVGDFVRLYDVNNKEYVNEVIAVKGNTFTVKSWESEVKEGIFVWGKRVDDFRTVDYDRIFTLNVSATQELYRQMQQTQSENKELKERLARLEGVVYSLGLLNGKENPTTAGVNATVKLEK